MDQPFLKEIDTIPSALKPLGRSISHVTAAKRLRPANYIIVRAERTQGSLVECGSFTWTAAKLRSSRGVSAGRKEQPWTHYSPKLISDQQYNIPGHRGTFSHTSDTQSNLDQMANNLHSRMHAPIH